MEGQRFRSLRRALWRIRSVLPPTRDLVLGLLALGLLAGWVLVMVLHWPPGGAKTTSNLVYTQGASLIFVVILLSLFNGPLSAGQRLGWDSGWVGRDTPTWLGLLSVATLSIILIWLGWIRPERAEEGASILLTAAGLCVTALTAQRLIYLSDLGDQLDARLDAQLPKLLRIIRRSAKRNERATRVKVRCGNPWVFMLAPRSRAPFRRWCGSTRSRRTDAPTTGIGSPREEPMPRTCDS
jgi:hypothetical protein